MTTVRVSKSRRVLALSYLSPNNACFQAGSDDDDSTVTSLVITREDWVEFGQPNVITATIEPGDLLNVPENLEDAIHAEGIVKVVDGPTGWSPAPRNVQAGALAE